MFTQLIKRATKLYFMHTSCVVIIFFNTELYKFGFSIYPFKKLIFDLSLLSVFCLFIFVDFLYNICAIIAYNYCLKSAMQAIKLRESNSSLIPENTEKITSHTFDTDSLNARIADPPSWSRWHQKPKPEEDSHLSKH